MSSHPNQQNLVVLGMHRSGTSMVCRLLEHLGFNAGASDELMDAQADNPRGFWERKDVVSLNDALLMGADTRWSGLAPVQMAPSEEIAAILAKMSTPWMLKDPRLVLTWEAWQKDLSGNLIVFVYRGPLGVAQSLAARNGFPLRYGLALWEYYNRRLAQILANVPHVAVSYDDLASAPHAQIPEFVRQLASRVHCDESKLDSASQLFEAQLNHSEASVEALAVMTSSQRELDELLRGVCKDALDPSAVAGPSRELEQLLVDFSALYAVAEDAEEEVARLSEAAFQLRKHRDLLDNELGNLQQEHRQVSEEASRLADENRGLAEQLAFLRESAMAFADSFPGRVNHCFSTLYKFVRLRPAANTAFDDILTNARDSEHKHREKPPSRLQLFVAVIRYICAHPVSSIRSFSWARLRVAFAKFTSGTDADLTVWVGQRFPAVNAANAGSLLPELGEELDELILRFPHFDSPQVSIVVPVFNQYRMTVFCLRSVLECTANIPYEVILADDASTDAVTDIEHRIHGIRVCRAPSNVGFLENCNAAAAATKGEFILLLNNDTAVTPGWLEAMLAVFSSRSTAGIVGPKLIYGNGKLQEAGGIIWDDASGWNYGKMDDATLPEYNYLKTVDYVSGACMLMRASLWQQLGGFDNRFAPAYYEDTDLCFATRQAGMEVIYQPAAEIFHFEGVTNGTDLGSGVKQHQVVNQQRFLEKWQKVLSEEHFANGQEVFLARDRSRRKRTVLVIDHYVPSYDKDAGSRSTWQYLQLMVELGYNVKFIGANFFPHQPYTDELGKLGVEVLVGERMARGLDNWLQSNASYIDTVYIHRPHVAEQFLPHLKRMSPKPKLVFFGHDLHYLRTERERHVTGNRTLDVEARRWREREYRIFDQVDRIYYPSQVEVDNIRAVDAALPVRAIPLYSLDIDEPPAYQPEQRQGMLFVGGFNHPPNIDGLNWFVSEVMPELEVMGHDIQLHVVGSNPTPQVEALASAGVTIHGYLSDEALGELYRNVRLAVVPLRYGAGVKGKVIEALQSGLPLVTTPIGAEGLPTPDSVMSLADTPVEFARKVAAAYAMDDIVRQQLACTTEYLQRYFSKSKAAEILREDFGEPELKLA